MQNNVLIGVLLSIAFVTPVIAWLFYLWYRSHLTRMHQEGQIFDRRNRDRAQANYEPADGTHNPVMGPYFTPRGWVRPKTRGSSHVLRPPQYVHPRQPIFTGVPNSDQHFQGPNRANTYSPRNLNQQPNPLSKRQQRRQRALQNKQRQQERQQRDQQQSQNEQRGNYNRKDQRKQKNTNQGQSQQKSPLAQSPKTQAGQDEHYNQWGNTREQHDQTSNHNDGNGWDNHQDTEQNDNNNLWGGDSNNDQGEQKNRPSRSPRRNSQDNQKNHGWDQDNNSPRERISSRDNGHHNDHGNKNLQDGWDNSRHVSPDRASRNEVESHRGWGQSDGTQQYKHSRNNYSNEDHQDRDYGWGDDDRKSYHKQSKGYRYASPERKSRGRSSPERDWGHDDHGERENYSCNRSSHWGHAEEHRGGNDTEKKERWQIELEENEKRHRSRSPSGRNSDAGWGNRSVSDWKEKQDW